jgi:hypothetical protein
VRGARHQMRRATEVFQERDRLVGHSRVVKRFAGVSRPSVTSRSNAATRYVSERGPPIVSSIASLFDSPPCRRSTVSSFWRSIDDQVWCPRRLTYDMSAE